MIKVLIFGALGRMGKKVYDAVCQNPNLKAVCGVDRFEDTSNPDFPIYSDLSQVTQKVDVIIDFSAPVSLDGILKYCVDNKTSAVLCATGYTQEHLDKIKNE